MIPQDPVERFLDLGTGSGVAALAATRFAKSVVATDITERSAHFARFNALLNGQDIEVQVGDMYQPVRGRQFDCIATHPPYVPSFKRTAIFRDAGSSGEEILKAAILGLPEYLRPGGVFLSVSLGMDTAEQNFEVRAREWLGDGSGEFDVLFGLGDYRTSEDFAHDLARSAIEPTGSDVQKWRGLFSELHTQRMVYGALMIRRRLKPGTAAPWTERRKIDEKTDAVAYLRFFRWRERLATLSGRQEIIHSVPRLCPDLKVIVSHKVQDQTLVPFLIRFRNGGQPFPTESEVDNLIVTTAGRVDGKTKVADLFQDLKKASLLPESLSEEDFIDLVAGLIERGFLEIENGI